MLRDESSLSAHLAGGGGVAAPEEMSAAYRGEIVRLMTVLTDSELAGAAGFADFVNRAPGLAERQALVRIAGEKLAHAGQVLELLRPFGVVPDLYVRTHPWQARIGREIDLGLRRIPGDKRLNVFHYPIQSWHDALLVNWLVGESLAIQLHDIAGCSYLPLADTIGTMAAREAILAALGEPMLKAAIGRDGSAGAAQVALDYWYPRAAATFGRMESERFDIYRRYRLRRETNQALMARWRTAVDPRLSALGLKVPSPA